MDGRRFFEQYNAGEKEAVDTLKLFCRRVAMPLFQRSKPDRGIFPVFRRHLADIRVKSGKNEIASMAAMLHDLHAYKACLWE